MAMLYAVRDSRRKLEGIGLKACEYSMLWYLLTQRSDMVHELFNVALNDKCCLCSTEIRASKMVLSDLQQKALSTVYGEFRDE